MAAGPQIENPSTWQRDPQSVPRAEKEIRRWGGRTRTCCGAVGGERRGQSGMATSMCTVDPHQCCPY